MISLSRGLFGALLHALAARVHLVFICCQVQVAAREERVDPPALPPQPRYQLVVLVLVAGGALDGLVVRAGVEAELALRHRPRVAAHDDAEGPGIKKDGII